MMFFEHFGLMAFIRVAKEKANKALKKGTIFGVALGWLGALTVDSIRRFA